MDRLIAAFVIVSIWLIPIIGWFYHVYYCLAHHEYVLLLIGALIAPIGIIHGYGAMFGVW